MNRPPDPIIERRGKIFVLRDDLLPGGTKSILVPVLLDRARHSEFVYASPAFGGFQVALSAFAGSRATIFTAKRKELHRMTRKCKEYGAKIVEIPHGYLTNVQAKARAYCQETGAQLLVFGAKGETSRALLAERMRRASEILGGEPPQIGCAVGSGTLVESILQGTDRARVHGVIVGAEYENDHPRLKLEKYPLPFSETSRYLSGFPSNPNYDLKALELFLKSDPPEGSLFWNVL